MADETAPIETVNETPAPGSEPLAADQQTPNVEPAAEPAPQQGQPAPVADPDARVDSTVLADFNARVAEALVKESQPEPIAAPAPAPSDDNTAIATHPVISIDWKAAPLDEFQEQRRAYLDTVEITPELEGILERQDAEIASARAAAADLETVGSREQLVKLGTAMERLYSEAKVDETNGMPLVNAKPLVEVFATDFRNEFRPIAEEILATPSIKYPGTTVLEEILIDKFGEEKARKMVLFGFTDAPLPVVAAESLPAGVDEENREAYGNLPRAKKLQIESLVENVTELEKELRDPDVMPFRQDDIKVDLRESKELLDAELSAIKSLQRELNYTREQARVRKEQQARQEVEFRNKVQKAYQTSLLDIRSAFATDLAPRLTYADADSQLSQARNILTRISDALSDDPFADHYAKELKEEGITYDWKKGRDLLQSYYEAFHQLENMKLRNASPQAILYAERQRDRIAKDIKLEQKDLIGKISAKYVKSHGSAIQKQVDEVAAKKQAVKKITSTGKPAHDAGPEKDAAADIEAWNRRVRESVKNGDDLFNQHAA